MLKSKDDIIKNYNDRKLKILAKIKSLKVNINKHSFYRVLMFLLLIFCFVKMVSVNETLWQYIYGFSMIIPIVVFMLIVKNQSKIERALVFNKNYLWVIENEILALIQHQNNYSDGSIFEDDAHPYTSDLDVFGRNSIYHKINRCNTYTGMNELAAWFIDPGEIHDILNRQEAIKEGKEKIDASFTFRAFLKAQKVGFLESILAKIENELAEEIKFTQKKWMKIYVSFMPFLMLALFFLSFIGESWGWGSFIIIAIVNLTIVYSFSRNVNLIHKGFSGLGNNLQDCADAIFWDEEQNWKSEMLKINSNDNQFKNVSQEIQELATIIDQFDARMNMIVNVFLNALMVWDLRCSVKLENWYKKSSHTIVVGLKRIPKLESILSISTLHYNYPNWNFPSFINENELVAVDLAHPLIPEESVISNDYNLKIPRVDIITGSNMSGKSTFLRSIGLNIILAYTGSPVSASNFVLPKLNIVSYMRIKDSLETKTSTFKAELIRLKMILEHVTQDRNTLVLIDEMLRGTNSHDKFEGSKAFILKMINLGVPTLFATHDLQLSALEKEYLGKVKNFHFDIYIDENEMKFDYKLKEGPCNVFNAAVLLKEIGL